MIEKLRYIFGKLRYKFEKMFGQVTHYYAPQSAEDIGVLRANFKEKLKDVINKDIINKRDGRVARISTVGRDKIAGSIALRDSIDNGFEIEEHFKAGENIQELFEDSFYVRSEQPKNESPNIVAIHRYSRFFQMNNKDAEAWLTLKESDEHGNRLYSLELDKISLLLQAPAHTKQAQQGQSNLTKNRDVDAKGILSAIEKTDNHNPTTKKQMSQEEYEKFIKERKERAAEWKNLQDEFRNSVGKKLSEMNKNSSETKANITQTTQKPSVDGGIDTNTSPRGPKL